jgi:two-component system nitrogen regulation response regulator NtrX
MVDKVLIVDDEENVCQSLREVLEDEGYQVEMAFSGEEALERIPEFRPDVVLLDVLMPGMDGLETLKRLKEEWPSIAVVMISAHGTIEMALKAIELGAVDFIEKPPHLERLLARIRQTVERRSLEMQNRALIDEMEQQHRIIAVSEAMRKVLKAVERVAPTNAYVLIRGESGTGKELIARAIHNFSPRRRYPFIEVNCAAIPKDLIEAELFGHEKGAFTGAVARKEGKFELADKGTLFLDEIGDMSLQTQAKVLRAIETQRFQRVGGTKFIKVDVRIITATNKNLKEEIAAGNFREDLYYRLNVVPIYIPPLRERSEDIPPLVEHFLKLFCKENKKPFKRISDEAMEVLRRYRWPGNVRELRNLIERLVILSDSDIIGVDDLPDELFESEEIHASLEGKTLREAKMIFERDFILRKLESHGWNITETAKELGIERTNLHRKIKQYGLRRSKG